MTSFLGAFSGGGRVTPDNVADLNKMITGMEHLESCNPDTLPNTFAEEETFDQSFTVKNQQKTYDFIELLATADSLFRVDIMLQEKNLNIDLDLYKDTKLQEKIASANSIK